MGIEHPKRLNDGPNVVIIGGGFGGLTCARSLSSAKVNVRLLDRRNFHLFQPLLYQVATGGLSPANIAAPLRSILRRQRNCQVFLTRVTGFNANRSVVVDCNNKEIEYDYLVISPGSTHHYFGRDAEWEKVATGLKSIEDATEIRRNILSAFESAEKLEPGPEQNALLTFVVVGGGPTGVELAGAVCELAHQTMKQDFRTIDPQLARVVLIENSPGILNQFHPSLGEFAKKSLKDLGAEVWNDARLMQIFPDYVIVSVNGEEKRLDTKTVLWAAGVRASSLNSAIVKDFAIPAEQVDRGGRIQVDQNCALKNHPNVYLLGDAATFNDEQGKPLPGVAPVAMQQGRFVGARISALIKGKVPTKSFKYYDKGNMATIGSARAIMEAGKIRVTGRLAWFAWLFIHIMYLVRFENRVLVLFQWFWNYVTRNRAARLITGEDNRQQVTPPNSVSV